MMLMFLILLVGWVVFLVGYIVGHASGWKAGNDYGARTQPIKRTMDDIINDNFPRN